MDHLPFWLSAVALASVPILHWLGLRRAVAVSGRYSALIDRLRSEPASESTQAMSEAELIAAMRAMTAQEFGEDALQMDPVEQTVQVSAAPAVAIRVHPQSERSAAHALFLVGLALGGALSVWFGSTLAPEFALRSELFTQVFGNSPLTMALVLFGGGMLVGVGTRMAGGCTSGHGLCGLSQLQKGSLVATLSFFATGVLVSFALRALL